MLQKVWINSDYYLIMSSVKILLLTAVNWIDPTYKPQTHQIKGAPNKETTGLMLPLSSPISVSTMTTASSKANLCTDDTSLSL